MGGVSHVKMGHSHPPSATVTAFLGLHVTVLQTSIASTSVLDPVATTGAIVRQEFAGWGWIEEGTQGLLTTAHLRDYLTKFLKLDLFVVPQNFLYAIDTCKIIVSYSYFNKKN